MAEIISVLFGFPNLSLSLDFFPLHTLQFSLISFLKGTNETYTLRYSSYWIDFRNIIKNEYKKRMFFPPLNQSCTQDLFTVVHRSVDKHINRLI